MNKQMCAGVIVVVYYVSVLSIQAIEPVSMVVGAVVITGVSKAIDGLCYLFGPSKSKQDYKERHEHLKTLGHKEFVADIESAREQGNKSELDILAQHELYRYEEFLTAIIELIPSYDQYIKALMAELDENPKARIVMGFETDHLYHKGAGIFRKKAKDFSEFYQLIQKLYAEVLQRERQALEQKHMVEVQQKDSPGDAEVVVLSSQVEECHE